MNRITTCWRLATQSSFVTELMFRDHISEKINKAYSILGIIKRNFIYMDEHTFISLYKSMVRPHVEFANLFGARLN